MEKKLFWRIIISFDKGEDAEEYIPIILRINSNKIEEVMGEIKLLETPEVYKRVIKNKKYGIYHFRNFNNVIFGYGGFGIMNLIASNIKSRTGHMGILRAMGMSSKDMVIMFITEGMIISCRNCFRICLGSNIFCICWKNYKYISCF